MLYGSETRCLRENKIAILSNGESNVWCKTDGEKEDRGPDGDVGIEGNSGCDFVSSACKSSFSLISDIILTMPGKDTTLKQENVNLRANVESLTKEIAALKAIIEQQEARSASQQEEPPQGYATHATANVTIEEEYTLPYLRACSIDPIPE